MKKEAKEIASVGRMLEQYFADLETRLRQVEQQIDQSSEVGDDREARSVMEEAAKRDR